MNNVSIRSANDEFVGGGLEVDSDKTRCVLADEELAELFAESLKKYETNPGLTHTYFELQTLYDGLKSNFGIQVAPAVKSVLVDRELGVDSTYDQPREIFSKLKEQNLTWQLQLIEALLVQKEWGVSDHDTLKSEEWLFLGEEIAGILEAANLCENKDFAVSFIDKLISCRDEQGKCRLNGFNITSLFKETVSFLGLGIAAGGRAMLNSPEGQHVEPDIIPYTGGWQDDGTKKRAEICGSTLDVLVSSDLGLSGYDIARFYTWMIAEKLPPHIESSDEYLTQNKPKLLQGMLRLMEEDELSAQSVRFSLSRRSGDKFCINYKNCKVALEMLAKLIKLPPVEEQKDKDKYWKDDCPMRFDPESIAEILHNATTENTGLIYELLDATDGNGELSYYGYGGALLIKDALAERSLPLGMVETE